MCFCGIVGYSLMKIASVEQMRQCDSYTIAHHVPSMELIGRAAYSVFREVVWHGRTAIVVGSGNNGADGFALSCILNDHHIDCMVFTVSPHLHAECAAWAEKAKAAGVLIKPYEKGCLGGFDILVDCMLGTGFGGSLKQTYREAIEEINSACAYVVSVDINSGMNGDSGAGELIVCSNLTVTVEFVKKGQLVPSARNYINWLVCVQIGIVDAIGLENLDEECCIPWLDTQVRKYI